MTALTEVEPYVASLDTKRSHAGAPSSSPLHSTTAELWGVILAGGEGIRLRPLTRAICGDERPKQYVTLTGSRSLLQQTLDRAALRIPAERTVVISVETHASYLAAAMPGRGASVLLQPADRGTAAGVLLPAHWIRVRAPGATVAVFPSDHLVLEEEAFTGRRCVPRIHSGLERMVHVVGRRARREAIRQVSATLPAANFSRDVLQNLTPMLAVTTLTGVTWCDWGSPGRVVRSLERLGIRPPWLDRLTEPVGAGREK